MSSTNSMPPAFPAKDSDYTGWSKLDISVVPSYAQITAVTLNLKAVDVNKGEADPAVCSSDACRPILQIQYSASDSWSRLAHPTPATLPRTQAVTATFPSPTGPPGFQIFPINLASKNWQTDLDDHFITLGISNLNTNFSYNLYYGSDDPAANKPYLLIMTCE